VAGANGAFTVSGTHSYAVAGQLPVAVTLADDAPGTATATAVSTADVSAPPLAANDDCYSSAHDQTLHVAAAQGVLANDNSGSALTAVIDTGPSVGSLTLNPDGSFDYTPPAGFVGTASFTYVADDPSQSSAPATVQIHIVDPHAPTGHSDFYDVLHDNTLHVAGPGVLGNDADADGDPITAVVAAGPQHGSLTLRADGSFDYTPVAGFAGGDRFTYQVGDGALTSAPVSVTLLVRDVAPTAQGDSYGVREDTTLHVAAPGVTGNDSDADTDALIAALVSGPGHGTLVFRADGSFDYTPAANYAGADSFTYRVNDGALDSNTATVNLAVTPVNDAPAGADRTVTTLEDSVFTFGVADFGFSDPNDTPANALRAVEITTLPTAGALTDNGVAVTAGQFISVADIAGGHLTFAPAANANGNGYASFTFQVQDDGGAVGGGLDLDQSPNTITVNVTPVNDAPAGADRTVTTLEDSVFTFGVADFGFSDPNDTPANALRAVEITTLPTAGALTDNGVAVTAGQFISVADIAGGHLSFAPAANASGNGYASFTFQVQDNGGIDHGGIDLDPTPNRITVNVTPVNDAPVIASGGGGDAASYFVRVNNTAITTLTATDADPGDAATFSIVGGADAGRFVIDAHTGALSFRSLPAQPHNAYELLVQASDGHGGADVQSLTVNVAAAMMVGDPAADTFVFHQKFGSNEVKNFDLDHDFLQFDRGMFAGDTAAAVLAAAHDQKGGVVIDAHASHLVIDNVTLAQLQAHANDFLFV
jgi:VCBS repeat-containing protein